MRQHKLASEELDGRGSSGRVNEVGNDSTSGGGTKLAGKVVIVTGAGSGLGRAAALHLAQVGATVLALSIVPAELEGLSKDASALGSPLVTRQVDVGDADQVHRATSDILEQFGGVDVLINNAGIIVLKPVEEMTIAEWDRVMATNLRSVFLFARELVPSMKKRSQGLIVNVSSQSGVKGFVGEAGYCPSKHGVEGLTKTLALELRPWNIFVVSVTPGTYMRTAMSLITLGPEEQAQWHEPDELAPAFAVLAAQEDRLHSGLRYDIWRLARTGSVDDGLAHDDRLT
jgi:NAD(P)-dependent dehydrogenase (short-subunit alcohol dehydrogenase family)